MEWTIIIIVNIVPVFVSVWTCHPEKCEKTQTFLISSGTDVSTPWSTQSHLKCSRESAQLLYRFRYHVYFYYCIELTILSCWFWDSFPCAKWISEILCDSDVYSYHMQAFKSKTDSTGTLFFIPHLKLYV